MCALAELLYDKGGKLLIMKIIKCTLEQLDEIGLFYDKVTKYLEENINYPRWINGDYPSSKSAEAAIETGTQYACVENEKIIGAFVLNDDPQGAYELGEWSVKLDLGEFLIIHALATDFELYHKGTARKMVEFCVNEAKSRGYKALRLDVVPDNYPARKLYESMGFSFAGEKNLRRFEHIPTFVLYEMNF